MRGILTPSIGRKSQVEREVTMLFDDGLSTEQVGLLKFVCDCVPWASGAGLLQSVCTDDASPLVRLV